MNVAIIPARGGSTRIPMKNVRSFHGRPIIAYSIQAAIASGLFDDVWVSTDNEEIGKIAMDYGAKFHPRSEEMSQDHIGTQSVMRNVLQELWPVGKTPEYACCIYATAPMMLPTDLEAGFKMLRDYNLDYVYAVDLQNEHAGQWYWGKTKSFVGSVPLEGSRCCKYKIHKNRVIDINTEQDWILAEQMYNDLHSAKSVAI